MPCKFFPGCIDEDECFFEHVDKVNKENKKGNKGENSFICANGDSCSDQSCKYSELSHKNMKNILCRFQASCNRLNCPFKHLCERKSFLGVSPLKQNKK